MALASRDDRIAIAEIIRSQMRDDNCFKGKSDKQIKVDILRQVSNAIDERLKDLHFGETLGIFFNVFILDKDLRTRDEPRPRNSPKMIAWRQQVFERDKYTCQKCGAQGQVQAHHKKSWAEVPESRYSLENGVTLCVDCHAKEHPAHTNLIKSHKIRKRKYKNGTTKMDTTRP